VSALRDRRCVALPQGTPPLAPARVAELHAQLSPGWQVDPAGGTLSRDFRFADYHRTMAFVNAVAWIAHVEDHHPDLEVGYGHCRVAFSTHTVGGLSDNDFICAAKVDAL
jgi:4a-hydroxytetrahydrobiopterin dehydratase